MLTMIGFSRWAYWWEYGDRLRMRDEVTAPCVTLAQTLKQANAIAECWWNSDRMC